MWSQNPSFRLEIDNFSKKKDDILSKVFVAGGCEWFLYVYPKGDLHADNHLSVYLRVANPKSLQIGWKRNASFYFVSKLEEIALERKESYDADESRVQQLEERIKNIELMDIGFKLDCVNTKLDNADESRVQQLEERVKDMSRKVGFKLDCLNTTIEERSLERKKSDDARFQQLEESVKNIELMVSCLKVELDKMKDKSTAEGFLLVD
ncbi:hypothetical protein F2Q68_00023820 [Brassica cretica]|uniref:MATH domain-containing protein n=1 Tax=Brassica cretica TaxID=69181 RepID=A0A8S9IBV6_BRACR|nr:hypothetical protein F2Q68_00023820 [Brassica cretica]